MPWWGWALIIIAVVVIVPLKLKILKKIMTKKNEEEKEDF